LVFLYYFTYIDAAQSNTSQVYIHVYIYIYIQRIAHVNNYLLKRDAMVHMSCTIRLS